MTLPFDFGPKPPPKPPAPPPEPPRALGVGELARALRQKLEDGWPSPVWVEGEIAGARPMANGHVYFTLKDEREEAALDATMYRTNVTQRARRLIADGARVRVRGRPTFWAPRGRLQLVVDRVEPVGKGALLEALEKLKEKLAAEGLFAEERKRPLPKEPRVVGVVTSAGGAAIHDICKVAFRRGGARILLASATVQGANAAGSIRWALAQLQCVRAVDVIIVGRGGGSSDDLSAFNDEAVVRAVARCRVPVVSAVGHEVDFTLTDFAADARAATPSQAAEMVVPDGVGQRQRLDQAQARLSRAMRHRITEEGARLGALERKLGDPRLAIAHHQQSLDDRTARLEACASTAIARRRAALARLEPRLHALHPRQVIAREQAALHRTAARLAAVADGAVSRRAGSVQRLSARLDAMSPLKVLARGYAIAALRESGRAVRSASEVSPGDVIDVRLARGTLEATVNAASIASPPGEETT